MQLFAVPGIIAAENIVSSGDMVRYGKGNTHETVHGQKHP